MIIGKNTLEEVFGIDPFVRFKSGGKSPPQPTSTITETGIGREAKSELFPFIESGLAGTGFGPPGALEQRKLTASAGLKRSFGQARGELNSQLNRTLDPRDTRVRSFLNTSLNRAYTSAQDTQRRGFQDEAIGDETLSRDIAATTIANEQRLGVNSAQAYNQALTANQANRSQFGTFATNVAGGIGSGVGDFLFAQKMAS